jgi:hypothetical protein
MNEAIQTRPRLKFDEQRRFQRVKVNLLGRFMLPSRQEFPCQITDMSPGDAALVTPVCGEPGDRIIAYVDHVGRIEGTVTRPLEGGFAIEIHATARKRDKLAAQLTWLANRHVLNLPEDRRHERMVPKNPFTHLTLGDGRVYKCRVIDVSLSGAAVTIDVKPAIGQPVTLGRMKARVVRHLEGGIAVEFTAVQTAESLERNIRPDGDPS